jgi:hypothetical protein
MAININDFIDKNDAFIQAYGGRSWDYKKLLNLSDEEFAEFYLKNMEEYRDNDGWWEKQKAPFCSECHKEISGPKELRRYYGASLHPECFKKVYEQYFLPSGGKSSLEKNSLISKYLERVSKLKL